MKLVNKRVNRFSTKLRDKIYVHDPRIDFAITDQLDLNWNMWATIRDHGTMKAWKYLALK